MNGIPLLTASQAAIYLDVCVRSLRTLTARGKVPVYRVGPTGGKTRWSQEDLDKYLLSCRCVGGKR